MSEYLNSNPVRWRMSKNREYVAVIVDDKDGNAVSSIITRDELVSLNEWFKMVTEQQTIEDYLGIEVDDDYEVVIVSEEEYQEVLKAQNENPEN